MIDAAERELFAASIRHAVTRETVDEVDRALTDVGWTEALQEWGGAALQVLFTEQGLACTTSSAIDDVLVHALGLADELAVVQPGIQASGAPGTIRDAGLSVRGLATARLARTGQALVVVDSTAGYRAVVVPASSLIITPIEGIDATAQVVAVEAEELPSSVYADAGPVPWPQAEAVGRLALACELVGVGRSMIALAREHAVTRVQFDRPIGSFQAVRYRLVDALLAVEAADAATTSTCEPFGPRAPGEVRPAHAAMAKALAGLGARTAARHCQQVLAGIGFTAEHDFHHHFRRVLLLDELLGSARVLTREVGARALADQRVQIDLPL